MPRKNEIKKRPSRACLVRRLRELYVTLKHPPTAADIRRESAKTRKETDPFPVLADFLTVFGSLAAAQKEARIPVTTRGGGRQYSKSELIDYFIAHAERRIREGKKNLPSSREIDRAHSQGLCPPFRVFRDAFGSYKKLLESVTPKLPRKLAEAAQKKSDGWRTRRKERIQRSLWDLNMALLRVPDAGDVVEAYKKKNISVSLATIKKVYGSLDAALSDAGIL